MPPVKTKKRKPKKIRYKKITFKLSEKQKMLIDRYCKVHKTSGNKMIKTAIREFLSRHVSEPGNEYHISENQLRLFDDEGDEGDGETGRGGDWETGRRGEGETGRE